MFFYFIKYPSRAFLASQNGLLLWFNQILPTLLPFSILSNIMLSACSQDRNQEIKTFARISIWEWFVIACGMCFGFPIGSKLTADLYERKMIEKERAEILCAFTNNMSPVFVCTYVCTNVLHNTSYILPMFAALYVPPLILGCLTLSAKPIHLSIQKKSASRFQLDMQIIDAGIISSFLTLIKLCGYIVMFSITADLLLQLNFLPKTLQILLVGCTEVTNGIAQLSTYNTPNDVKFILAVFFLALGGISGLAQTNSMLAPAHISLKKYIKWKILYTSCSVLGGIGYIILL